MPGVSGVRRGYGANPEMMLELIKTFGLIYWQLSAREG